MRKITLLFLFLSSIATAQNYVDIFKIGYGQSFNNDFEGTANSTQIKTLEADLTLPLVLNEQTAIVTGLSFSRNSQQLFPEGEFVGLYSTALKAGLSHKFNEKYSATLIFLPKIASDYEDISGDDFYFGGYGIFRIHKSERLVWRIGGYASSEAFGIFSTPIFGWYYLSPSGRFEMDMSLPVAADINYCLGLTTIGMDYFGIGRSFRLSDKNLPEGFSNLYTDFSALEFTAYVQFNVMKEVLLRAKLGYSSTDYELYDRDEKIDLGLSAFTFGDDRTQVNPNINGGLFIRFEAIYRFRIPDNKQSDSPE